MDNTSTNPDLFPFSARLVLGTVLGTAVAVTFVLALGLGAWVEDPWLELCLYYAVYGAIFWMLAAQADFRGIDWQRAFITPPAGVWPPALALTLFVLGASASAVYLLYVPLSFVFPGFVEWWVLADDAYWLMPGEEGVPVAASFVWLVFLTVLTPLLEEGVFRGLLLHRWVDKYGAFRGVIYTSLLFAVLHTDVIGGFVFGVVMCFVYFKTRSLWVPVVCHSLNNAAFWLLVLLESTAAAETADYTLHDFRTDWPLLITGAVLMILGLACYRRWPLTGKSWLPELVRRSP